MKQALLSLLLVATTASVAMAQQPINYTAAYVMEPSTGRVLFEYNAHQPLPTASMAKMMTLLIVMESVRDGQLTLDTPVPISARSSKMGGSQIYAKQGQTFPVDTLVAATMIQSANDAAQALAERIAGSSEAFADLMNDRAKKLGLKESTFYDPHGLPSRETGKDDVMSAHDLAILGRELMKFPLIRKYAAMPKYPFQNGTFTSGLTNPNHLLGTYDGADGIKTGYSVPAGFCVTASAQRGKMRVIAVVMGAKQAKGPTSSFESAARLMNEAFANYRAVTPFDKGTVVGQAVVRDGQSASVPVIATAAAEALVKRGEEQTVRIVYAGQPLTAPVRRGDPAGTVLVQQGGQTIAKIPAVAANDVAKQPMWKKFWPF